MRIRRRVWTTEELENSKFYIKNPVEYKGKWKEQFENVNNPLHIELGCGKGGFIATLAFQNPNTNYIAVDIKDVMLGFAKRNIEKVYETSEPSNVLLVDYDIERILDVIDETDKVDRIYINFCNPWPKARHRKKRLTHNIQLGKYKKFLDKGGEIHFKTDDEPLFYDSLTYFKEAGFEITYKTFDLHSEEKNLSPVMTEHEKMFSEEGIKIKFLIAKQNN